MTSVLFGFLSVADRGTVTGLCISVRIWGVHQMTGGSEVRLTGTSSVELDPKRSCDGPTSSLGGTVFHHCACVFVCVTLVLISLEGRKTNDKVVDV